MVILSVIVIYDWYRDRLVHGTTERLCSARDTGHGGVARGPPTPPLPGATAPCWTHFGGHTRNLGGGRPNLATHRIHPPAPTVSWSQKKCIFGHFRRSLLLRALRTKSLPAKKRLTDKAHQPKHMLASPNPHKKNANIKWCLFGGKCVRRQSSYHNWNNKIKVK